MVAHKDVDQKKLVCREKENKAETFREKQKKQNDYAALQSCYFYFNYFSDPSSFPLPGFIDIFFHYSHSTPFPWFDLAGVALLLFYAILYDSWSRKSF